MDNKQTKVLLGLTYAMIIFGFFFLRSYMMIIISSAIMTVLFNPVYKHFLKKGRSPGTASVYTFTVSVLSVIIPLIFVSLLTFYQVTEIITAIGEKNYSLNINDLGNDAVVIINDTMEGAGVAYRITFEELTSAVSSATSTFGKELFQDVVGSFAGIFGLITAAIIYIYVFLSMLVNQDKILNIFRKLNPLGDEISDLYIARAGAMTNATVRGQFIIALMQGFASAVVIALVGPSGLFFFFFVLLTVMSIIPMGAGIITIPLGILMIITGNVSGGIIVIANHLIIVTNIDNIMRPKLVPASAKLDPALMMLAVFAGMALFGLLGIVIGPILMILIVTTLQIYSEVFQHKESIDRRKYPKKTSPYKKLKRKFKSSKA